MTAGRRHGTHACYVWGPAPGPGKGCRCDACHQANRDYERARRQRIAPPYIDATEARQHIKWLNNHGIGLKTISTAAGISHGTLSKLIYGDPARDMAPSRRIRPTTHQAIIRLKPADFTGGQREPAGPILELVDRLVAAGIPKLRIAERLGQRGPLQLGDRYITRRNAATIRQMVAELDAGTLITVRKSRHGDTIIQPPAAPRSTPTSTPGDDIVLAVAQSLETRNEHAWRADAACRGRDNWMWFPSSTDHATAAAAKRICSACTVRAQCLDAHRHEPYGIWGGLTPAERRVNETRRNPTLAAIEHIANAQIAARGRTTAREIHTTLTTEHQALSIRAVHRHIATLVAEGRLTTAGTIRRATDGGHTVEVAYTTGPAASSAA